MSQKHPLWAVSSYFFCHFHFTRSVWWKKQRAFGFPAPEVQLLPAVTWPEMLFHQAKHYPETSKLLDEGWWMVDGGYFSADIHRPSTILHLRVVRRLGPVCLVLISIKRGTGLFEANGLGNEWFHVVSRGSKLRPVRSSILDGASLNHRP